MSQKNENAETKEGCCSGNYRWLSPVAELVEATMITRLLQDRF